MGLLNRIFKPDQIIEAPKGTPPAIIEKARALAMKVFGANDSEEMLEKLHPVADEQLCGEKEARDRKQFLDRLNINPEHLRTIKTIELAGELLVDIRVPVGGNVPSTIVIPKELSDSFSKLIDSLGDNIEKAKLSEAQFDESAEFTEDKGFLLYDSKTYRRAILVPKKGLSDFSILDLGVKDGDKSIGVSGMTMEQRTEMFIGVPGAVGRLFFPQGEDSDEED